MQLLMTFLYLIPYLPLIIIGILILKLYIPFRNSEYKDESGNTFLETVTNKGNYAEYLAFSYLEKLDVHSNIMTNLYIPREDGTTTEVDLVMISNKGIYVIESKNYGGWIYGNDKNTMWTQTLPGNKKNHFYNPIWQNAGHISAIKRVLEDDRDGLYKSYIVFSERCTLKKISLDTDDVVIIKRNQLIKSINSELDNVEDILTEKEVFKYYWKLRYFRRASDQIKSKHIESIRNRLS